MSAKGTGPERCGAAARTHEAPAGSATADGALVRHQLMALLHAATDYSIIGTDPHGTITLFNEGAERLLGYRADELVGWRTPLVFHDPREVAERAAALGIAPGFEVFVASALRGCPETRDWTYIRRDGTRFPVALNVVATRDEQGRLLGFIGIARDLTGQRRAAEAHRELERQKDAFFASVSHELRTPLTAIKASIGVVLANEPPGTPEPVHRLLANIERATDRMAMLVEDVLELANVQAGRTGLRRERCDLRRVARRAVRGVEPLAQARGQHLDVTLPAQPVIALADATRLERALFSLLHNAQKYGQDGGVICLTLSRRRGEAAFTVADDGPGIPLEEQGRIFERFPRSDPEVVQPKQGSGLGLAIARMVARLHGGRLWVDSSPGGGATFYLAVPLEPALGIQPVAASEEPRVAEPAGGRIKR